MFRCFFSSPGISGNGTVDSMGREFSNDTFCYVTEGFLILIVGSIGLVGNVCSLFLFARQKVHRIFHNLLFLLAIFDLVRQNTYIRFFFFFLTVDAEQQFRTVCWVPTERGTENGDRKYIC